VGGATVALPISESGKQREKAPRRLCEEQEIAEIEEKTQKDLKMNGINFIEPLFYATIERRKFQTRRIAKPMPDSAFVDGNMTFYRPRHKVGDVVYLKEPYRVDDCGNGDICVRYKFDKYDVYRRYLNVEAEGIDWKSVASAIKQTEKSRYGYANKLFMSEWAARRFIRITETPRLERLQDISEEDCTKEGIVAIPPYDGFVGTCPAASGIRSGDTYEWLGITYREAYAALINKINGRGTWNSNPAVYVYDYELIE
jgi:hypothetical protein